MINSICVVSEGYPYKDDPQFSFVEELCRAFARKGIRVDVISPQSVIHILLRKEKKHPIKRTYSEDNGAQISVYRPLFLQLPYKYRGYNEKAYKKAVERTFKKNCLKPDVCYGHFWNNGYYISRVAKENGLPLFVASGEGNFDDLEELYTSNKYREFSKDVAGVICVSSSCRDISVSLGLTNSNKCIVIPNAINHRKFYKKDNRRLRVEYGIPQEKFIVAFTGSFIHRKGSDRLSAALDKLCDPEIGSFFIGGGQGPENLVPTCKGVLFCGKLPHDKISDYLNMSDVFVLPTLSEGCCNAIIEAMACGLPIISSDRPFNHDLLDKTNAILINPMSIEEIADAIKLLKDNREFRTSLSKGAIETAQKQEINIRAEKIIDFINARL